MNFKFNNVNWTFIKEFINIAKKTQSLSFWTVMTHSSGHRFFQLSTKFTNLPVTSSFTPTTHTKFKPNSVDPLLFHKNGQLFKSYFKKDIQSSSSMSINGWISHSLIKLVLSEVMKKVLQEHKFQFKLLSKRNSEKSNTCWQVIFWLFMCHCSRKLISPISWIRIISS